MRRVTPFLVLILALAFAPEAGAKEIVALKVCGPSDCRVTRDPGLIQATEASNESVAPGEKAAWYRVEARMAIEGAPDERFELAFAPRLRMMRGGDPSAYYWMLLSKDDARAFSDFTEGMAAFPASGLSGTGPPAREAAAPDSPDTDEGGFSLPWIGVAVLLAGAAVLLVRRGVGLRRDASP